MGNHSLKKIGFFGGTFDPIHFGHLNLAIELAEKGKLDEIWFSPAYVSPLKKDEHPLPVLHRLEMLRLATQGIPFARIYDQETHQPAPSYTYETLKVLTEKEKDKQFFLLLGDDSLTLFSRWYKPLEIVRLVPLLVGSRLQKFNLKELHLEPEIEQSIQKGWMPTTHFEISATNIRERLKWRLYCGHLLPKEVLDYIKEHHLYLNS